MLKIAASLIMSLNEKNIRWMIWKGCYHYRDGLEGTGDIDLLIHPDDRAGAVRELKQNGFLHYKTQGFMERMNVEDWIGLDAETKKLIHVHLHYSMVFGRPYVWEYSFKAYEQCFASVLTMDDGVKLQNPCWEYILFLCRMRKEKISKEKVKNNLVYFREKVSSDNLREVFGEAVADKNAERLFLLLHSEQFETDRLLIDDIINDFMRLDISNSRVRSIGRDVQAKIFRRLAMLR